MRRTWSLVLFVLSLGATAPTRAGADETRNPNVTQAADTLFRLAREFFDQKRYDEACRNFAESFRLDPATGALLALAACHEAQGKTASAWFEYNDVLARSRREGRADRAVAAQERAAELRPQLSKLTVQLAPGAMAIDGLVVRRDGVPLAPNALGSPMVVDPGEHLIEASAPRHEPWSARILVNGGGASLSFAVPGLLAPAEGSVPPLARRPPWPLRTIGLVTGAVGVAALGIGSYFGLQAISNNNASQNDCPGNLCNADGKKARLDAIEAGNIATGAFVVGGLLVAGGGVLFFLGSRAEPRRAVVWTPVVGASAAGASLLGRF